jgi:predicted protein tyrosine phosphatase
MATYILNKYQAQKFKLNPSTYNVLIRITSPSDEFLPLEFISSFRDVIELQFYDFIDDSTGLYVFNENIMDKILRFFEEHKFCDNMVIHCDQGMSRSAGVAVGWFIFKNDNGSAYKIYHDKKHLPNKLIAEMFANKLNKRFLKFLQKWDNERSST